jgi:hypothetical protein
MTVVAAPAATVEQLAAAEGRLLWEVRQARDRFTPFVSFVMRDETGAPFELAPIHFAWHAHVDYCWSNGLHAGIMAPWGSGKTAGLVIPLVCWLLGKNPNERIKVICNDDASAQKRVGPYGGVGGVIERNQAFKLVFPHCRVGEKWTQHELYLERVNAADPSPSLQAHGVLATGIGGRATKIIFDDVVDQKNSLDAAQREKVRDLMSATWLSRLQPEGRALLVSTPWHLEDATHAMMGRRGWCFLIQRVNTETWMIDQEVVNAGADYPGLLPLRGDVPKSVPGQFMVPGAPATPAEKLPAWRIP